VGRRSEIALAHAILVRVALARRDPTAASVSAAAVAADLADPYAIAAHARRALEGLPGRG